MEKLSGLVLDFYDDPSGEVLRSVFPTRDSVPGIVKEAHTLTSDERKSLPDDAFALILMSGDVELKKFATIDPGNTALSVEYFLKTAHKLPVEAQKVAAHNLCCACGWFGIEPPEELQKIADSEQKTTGHPGKGALLGGAVGGTFGAASMHNTLRNPEYRDALELGRSFYGEIPTPKTRAQQMTKFVVSKMLKYPRTTKGLALAVPGAALGAVGGAFVKIKKKGSVPESQKVTVSRVPKVRERQLEALKSSGIKGPTKTAELQKTAGSKKDRPYYLQPDYDPVEGRFLHLGKQISKLPRKRGVLNYLKNVKDPSRYENYEAASKLINERNEIIRKFDESRGIYKKAIGFLPPKTAVSREWAARTVGDAARNLIKADKSFGSRQSSNRLHHFAQRMKAKGDIQHLLGHKGRAGSRYKAALAADMTQAFAPPGPALRAGPDRGATVEKAQARLKILAGTEKQISRSEKAYEEELLKRVRHLPGGRITLDPHVVEYGPGNPINSWVMAQQKVKKGMAKEAIGFLPLALTAMMAPGAAKEVGGRLKATKGMGGMVLTPQQQQMRSLQMGVRQ